MNDPRDDSLSGPLPIGVPVWVHATALGGMLLLILLLIGITTAFQGQNIWNGWTEAHELRHPGYAETIHINDVFRTRANTWSNLAYVLVGFYALALGRLDLRRKHSVDSNYLLRTPALSFLFGITCCYLGLGSGLFHASLTRLGQQLDVAAMYAPLLAFVAINLGRFIPRLKFGGRPGGFPTWPILTALVLVASFLLFKYKWSMRSTVVLPTLILTVTGFALLDRFLPRRQFMVRWMILSGVALVSARVCWQLDVAGKFSGPDTWLQGHAVWHLLTGLSLGCMYLYYRSEEFQPALLPAPTR